MMIRGGCEPLFFVPYSVEKMRGLGIFKTLKHSK